MNKNESRLGLLSTIVRGALSLNSITGAVVVPAMLCLAGAGGTASAQSQVASVQPYVVVAVRDGVEIRGGDSGSYYAVGSLKTGQAIRVDGQVGSFLRVEYLPGMRAFVSADDGRVNEATKIVTLSKPSKLLAANEKQALGANWWPLMSDYLPVNTNLNLIEVLKGQDGKTYGYLVAAPAGSRGYVSAQAVRKATDEESTAFLASLSGTPTTPATPVTTAANPAPSAVPQVAPVTPVTPVAPATPATPTGSGPQQGTTTTPTTTAPAPAPVVKPIHDMQVLADLFDGVMSPEKGIPEIDAVMAEFNRAIKATDDTGLRDALETRLQALKLKKEVIERAAKLKADSNYDERERKVRDAIVKAQQQSVYAIVGKILPSTVYDGRNGMPLMFRIESADSSSTRTIGYVIPEPGVNVLTKSGKVVGIVGISRYDEALRLNIVTASRVDVLTAGGEFVQDSSSSQNSTPASEDSAAPTQDESTPDSGSDNTVEDPGMDTK